LHDYPQSPRPGHLQEPSRREPRAIQSRFAPTGLILACVLGGALAGCVSDPAPEIVPEESISLSFEWPDAIELRVQRQYERTDRSPSGERTVQSSGGSVWYGARFSDGYRIQFAPFEYDANEPLPTSSNRMAQVNYLARQYDPVLPAIRVDAEGRIESTHGAKAIRKALRGAFMNQPGLWHDPAARSVIEAVTSVEFLEQRVRQLWSQLVGAWAEGELQIGQSIHHQTPSGSGAHGFAPSYQTYSAIAHIPCAPPEAVKRCIRLEILQKTDTSDFERSVTPLVGEEFLAAIPGDTERWARIDRRFVLDTDSASLIPQRSIEEKRFDIFWRDDAGATFSIGQSEWITLVFTRKDPPET
jgi:hypothetical protein